MTGSTWLRRTFSRPGVRYDAVAVLVFVLIAFWITGGLWLHPGDGVGNNPADQAFFEWALAHGARFVTHGGNPFHSSQMGVPTGVNMMANTSVFGISIPLAPITLLFGPRLSFNLAVTFGLILTATSWYFVVARALLHSRAAGWVAALLCGFGPGLVAHANAHINLVAQAMVPLLIWRTLRLAEPGRWLRNGLWLALVAIVQFFINAEMMLMVAVALGCFVLVMCLNAEVRARWRSFVAGLLVAGGVTLVVVAYPLWVLLFGPGAYTQVPPGYQTMGADLQAYIAFSRQSLAGSAATAARLAQNPTEENAFFGWPLMIVVVGLVIALRRRRHVIALAVAGLVAAVLSLGPFLILGGRYHNNISMPGRWVAKLPLFDSIVPTRWALIVTMVIGVLLAVAVTELRSVDGRRLESWLAKDRRWVHTGLRQRLHGRPRAVRLAGGALIAAVLVPLAPLPLPVSALDLAPPFLQPHGPWRQYAAGGRSLMFLPMASNMNYDPLRWSADTLNDMAFTQGYYLTAGPGGAAIATAPARFLTRYVEGMSQGMSQGISQGMSQGISQGMSQGFDESVTRRARREAYADLHYWRVGAIVLLPGEAAVYGDPMTALLGFRPTTVGGVQIWDVRGLSGPPPPRRARL